MIWLIATIAAAFFQNLRSALQKALKGRLSTMGAAYARFIYALPFAVLYFWAISNTSQGTPLEASPAFYLWCLLGAVSQILFTVVLLWLFSFRSFAVGTTFSKLEVVLVAVMGAVLLGERPDRARVTGALATVAGVVLIALAR